jgi:hypothetical protein
VFMVLISFLVFIPAQPAAIGVNGIAKGYLPYLMGAAGKAVATGDHVKSILWSASCSFPLILRCEMPQVAMAIIVFHASSEQKITGSQLQKRF